MKFLIFVILGLLITVSSPQVFAGELKAYTNQQVYATQHPLLVYGTGPENIPLVLRLFAPAGTIAEFEQIITNPDGSFSYKMLTWPDSSTKFPYGTYTVEAITNTGESQKIDIKFASSTELELIPIERKINTQVFAPEIAATDRTFRVFVQVTSDGLLVSGDANAQVGWKDATFEVITCKAIIIQGNDERKSYFGLDGSGDSSMLTMFGDDLSQQIVYLGRNQGENNEMLFALDSKSKADKRKHNREKERKRRKHKVGR